MSKIAITGAATGTATFTIESPATSTNRTLTIPDATTTIVGTDATQTLTNKTLGSGLVMGASTITSGTSQASTSGTSIDFTGIPAYVKRVTVMFDGVSTNGTSNHSVQLGDAGGIETTGYASACTFCGSSTNGTSSTTGFVTTTSIGPNTKLAGFVVLSSFSGNTWVSVGGSIFDKSSISAFTMTNSGIKTLSDTLTQLRITTVNGTDTFDAGSINILFE